MKGVAVIVIGLCDWDIYSNMSNPSLEVIGVAETHMHPESYQRKEQVGKQFNGKFAIGGHNVIAITFWSTLPDCFKNGRNHKNLVSFVFNNLSCGELERSNIWKTRSSPCLNEYSQIRSRNSFFNCCWYSYARFPKYADYGIDLKSDRDEYHLLHRRIKIMSST